MSDRDVLLTAGVWSWAGPPLPATRCWQDQTDSGALSKWISTVVGIAGGPEKCRLLTDQLGFDAAVDHRADDWAAQLAVATPNGIDVDFENVGGDIMDAIFGRLKQRGARCALRPDLWLQLGSSAAC